MSIMYFVNETNKTFLRHPAFLVGNGINYSKENTISWTDLLIKLFSTDQADDSVIKVVNGEKQLDLDGLTYPEIAELAELYSISEKEKSENRKKKLIGEEKNLSYYR